jgi:elongation factor Ts
MAEITASLVKDLREKTGAGMMDCKKALSETAGDIEAAVDWLRKKGLSAAAKKASRTAAEGLVGVALTGKTGAVIEVNSETDFVAKNDIFQGFVRAVAGLAVEVGGDVEKLAASSYPGENKSVQDKLTENIATIGENQTLRRGARLSVGNGAVGTYVHNAAGPGLGKIGVLIAVESEADVDALAKQLAMQIAASNPLAVDGSGIDAGLIARERAIAEEKAAQSGKPADVQAKMVDGAIRKFIDENTLMGQPSIMDGKTKVADVVAQAAKTAGKPIKVAEFVRFQLGEGIEKTTSDFAAEVAAAMGQG